MQIVGSLRTCTYYNFIKAMQMDFTGNVFEIMYAERVSTTVVPSIAEFAIVVPPEVPRQNNE